MKAPEISIILPFFNRRDTLARSVRSALAQTFADWELVAVDDASTDGGAAWLEALGDPRVRVLRHPRNLGAGPARDTAMQAARGEYLALLDSDDEWLPHKLERQRAALAASPGTKLSSCAYELHRDGRVTLLPKPFDPTSWERSLHCECTFGFGTTLLIHRSVVARLGGFDPALPRHEDWDWVLRAFEMGESLAFVPETLARVFTTGTPGAALFAESTERFLRKHDAAFAKFGARYRRRIRAYHYESISALAYAQRSFALGHRHVLRSFTEAPGRNPLALAALPLGALDWMLGTRLIQRAADLRRAWYGHRLGVVESAS